MRRPTTSRLRPHTRLTCSSCAGGCTWQGFADYDASTAMFALRASGSHGDRQRKSAGVLTQQQRCLLMRSRARTALGRLAVLNDLAVSPPSKKQEANRHKNARRGLPAVAAPTQTVQVRQDILDVLQKANVAESTPEECFQAFDREPHRLYCVSQATFHIKDREACAFCLTTPTMCRTTDFLQNALYIKVGADATFKDVARGWSLIAVGVYSRTYETTRYQKTKIPSWCTHFNPVLYVLTSSDSAPAYELAFRALAALPAGAGNGPSMLVGPQVRQVHADHDAAIEAARVAVYPDSIRCGDFFHMWKCVQSRARHLQDSQQELLWQALSLSRTYCAQLCEFHYFWTCFFHLMKQWKQPEFLQYLKTWFFTLSTSEAQRQYGFHQPAYVDEQSPEFRVLAANWWASYRRIQPGSACGSQPIESSHGNQLRATLVAGLQEQAEGRKPELRRLPPNRFIPALASALQTMGKQLLKTPPKGLVEAWTGFKGFKGQSRQKQLQGSNGWVRVSNGTLQGQRVRAFKGSTSPSIQRVQGPSKGKGGVHESEFLKGSKVQARAKEGSMSPSTKVLCGSGVQSCCPGFQVGSSCHAAPTLNST